MSFIRENQLDIMLFMSGMAAILTFAILVTKTLSQKRKSILAFMSFTSFLMLICERFAYIFSGDSSELAYYMVRISNGIVFFSLIFILHLVTQYLKDQLKTEGKLKNVPVTLTLCDIVFFSGAAALAVAQFTNIYYSFDAQNVYQREPGFVAVYVPPVVMVILQELTVIKYRKRMRKIVVAMLSFSIALPSVASFVQLLSYGVSLTCMSTVFVVVVYYAFVVDDMNKSSERARKQEIEFYKESQRIEAAMFEQTAQALVSAIDAKDEYTRGHSIRVAVYSRKIAEQAGLPKADCDDVYFAALLHDVGKIGISDTIINKVGRLTDEEYAQIKQHTVIGDQILSGISQSPYLRVGALYHHERYDGTGYPEGLSGENIPRIARIIAVADTYDAMNSNRSYRKSLPVSKIRHELKDGMGKQFEPMYAEIMLKIIDSEYRINA